MRRQLTTDLSRGRCQRASNFPRKPVDNSLPITY